MSSSRNDFFFEYFQERVAFVERACLERIEGQILMCCYIDSLAGYRYGGRSTGDRFRRFILEHGNSVGLWGKLSLMTLFNDISAGESNFPKGFGNLLQRQWGSLHNFYQLDFNPDIEIEKLEDRSRGIMDVPWSDSLRKAVEKYEYTRILWRVYRTNVVHETSLHEDAAPVGLGSNEDVPFYRHINTIDSGKFLLEVVRLRIPPKFILTTLKECIQTFRSYLDAQSIEVLKH